jgi:A/G-specific adenine glycosylase
VKKTRSTETPDLPQLEADAKRDALALMDWYHGVKRDLPWRKNRDPYRIWVSEVMLQQTTVAAVIPFYERFMKRFPNLLSLAQAPVEDVIENWAGLGYYSRARNLHKSAQALAEGGFPKTAAELLEFPGFGPYTARAVSSLAFDEKTGVLDGNVIRVLSRRYGLKLEWWKPQARAQLQVLADRLAQVDQPADLNQGMMELGATICTPQSPTCLLCPWNKGCVARHLHAISEYPLRKPRRDREVWHWRPQVIEKKGAVLLIPNTYAPFLKGHWILPGEAELLTAPPPSFDYKGTVTHHDIFVSIARVRKGSPISQEEKWVPLDQLSREIPASMIRKAIEGVKS